MVSNEQSEALKYGLPLPSHLLLSVSPLTARSVALNQHGSELHRSGGFITHTGTYIHTHIHPLAIV